MPQFYNYLAGCRRMSQDDAVPFAQGSAVLLMSMDQRRLDWSHKAAVQEGELALVQDSYKLPATLDSFSTGSANATSTPVGWKGGGMRIAMK